MVTIPRIGRVEIRRHVAGRNREGDKGKSSWLKKAFVPRVSNWLKPHDPGADGGVGCFFPSPKITFLIDKPENLICQVCHQSRFVFDENADTETGARLSDSVPAIMPCGHIAGARCLSEWLRDHDTCPFCRHELVYNGCGHQIPTRHITKEEIFLIPPTIPEGGDIPNLCIWCYKDAQRKMTEARFKACKRRFIQARKRSIASAISHDDSYLAQRKADLENIMLDEYHIKVANAWLAHW
ncbi:uncharacterized protein CTRU02_212107 [Colletotrichum truncatum]|uniref:Uncharacterized protein n=1 Tax=Colletotrichum truncatum TaxID=5467 RepID=A0ACC3YML5_COLTU|nr:uncharacterized protein CTRU02_06823 [Colletotrichum truncatum]KAF6792206.1 hypothetical protein CTRU02_06823 [Colletotrichum truncatum]